MKNTVRLEVGMTLLTEAGSTGDVGQGVTITGINGNIVTISQAPATAGAATLTFSSLDSLNVTSSWYLNSQSHWCQRFWIGKEKMTVCTLCPVE